MKPVTKKLFFSLLTTLFVVVAFAQDNTITVDTGEAESWLSRYWMWVVGGIILLIVLLGAGSSRVRKTTTSKDYNDGTTRTTTTVTED